jgi:GTP-dependent dephospho-CoA kinase
LQDAYQLPQGLRSRLAKPLGRLFTGDEAKKKSFADAVSGAKMVITVGDKVTETVYALGRTPDIQVVDGFERRMKRLPPEVPYSRLIEVKNPAGVLTREAIIGVRAAYSGRKPARVLVEGEEDLVAIPVIALAPTSAVVFYGQPGVGIVAVKADSRAKARNRSIMAKMGIRSLANVRVG